MIDPKAECERLMAAVIPFAEQMLSQYGEFFPYGAALDRKDAIIGVATNAGRDQPTPEEVLEAVKKKLAEGVRLGDFKATAVVFDVEIKDPQTGARKEAIAVALDHEDEYAVTVFFAYERTDGKIVVGEPVAHAGANDFFRRRA